MTDLKLPVSITYDTSGTTPIPEIALALQAADIAIQDAISLLPSLFDGLHVENSKIRIRSLSQESPLREFFVVGLVTAAQQSMQPGASRLLEDLFNVNIPSEYDSIVTLVVALVLVYGASFLRDAALKVVEDGALRRQLDGLITSLSLSTGKSKDEIRKILDAKYGSPGPVKRLTKAIGGFFTPSQIEGAMAITFDRSRLDPEVIQEVPYRQEFSENKDLERYQMFQDVTLEIHAQDKDKINTGWAAIPVGLSDRRLKMKLVEPVTASDIWTRSRVVGDITIVSKMTASGYVPSEIHLLRLR